MALSAQGLRGSGVGAVPPHLAVERDPARLDADAGVRVLGVGHLARAQGRSTMPPQPSE